MFSCHNPVTIGKENLEKLNLPSPQPGDFRQNEQIKGELE